MRVKDLLLVLNEVDPNEEVYIAQPTHDYWKSVILVTLDAIIRPEAYSKPDHDGNFELVDEDDEEDATFRPLVLTSQTTWN